MTFDEVKKKVVEYYLNTLGYYDCEGEEEGHYEALANALNYQDLINILVGCGCGFSPYEAGKFIFDAITS